MKRLYTLAIALVAALLVGCAGPALKSPSTNAVTKGAFDTVDAYVQLVSTSLVRGRMTPDQAEKAKENASKARAQVIKAEEALALCKPDAPCVTFADLMRNVQPSLLEFERELRAKEGAKP